MMPPHSLFLNRTCAGEQLARAIASTIMQLRSSGVSARPIVYALPRGGVPVAAQVARLLDCPLAVVVAKKISLPDNSELAIGAVTTDGQVLWAKPKLLRRQESRLEQAALMAALNKAQSQLAQLAPACPQIDLEGAIAILIDDGVATGMTMAVAAQALRAQHPAEVWLCAPVAPLSLLPWLQQWADRVIILKTPQSFSSVSQFYTEFPQVEIEEALVHLQQQNQID